MLSHEGVLVWTSDRAPLGAVERADAGSAISFIDPGNARLIGHGVGEAAAKNILKEYGEFF